MTAIPANQVKDLREMTGAGMMDCKRALTECNGDMEAAKDWLRKRGQAIADKKAARKAADGLIFRRINETGTSGALLELNCETDFVARNDKFLKIGEEVLDVLLAPAAGSAPANAEAILALTAPEAGTFAEYIRQNTATIGEKIEIGRIARLDAAAGECLHAYIHPPGKLGVLLQLKAGSAATLAKEAFQTLRSDLAMHIAAAAPEFLDRSAVPAERIEREMAIYREQIINEGKPEAMADKIAAGKLNKFFQQICLVEQEFVKEGGLSIAKLLERVSKELGDTVSIAAFARVKVGA